MLIECYPNVVMKIKQKFLLDRLRGLKCENRFGYPSEDFIDNYLYENYRSSYED